MNTTFFANGTNNSVYVLECGDTTTDSSVAQLGSFLNANPDTVFGILVPRSFDTNANFKTLTTQFATPNDVVRFFVTTTTSTYSAWTVSPYNTKAVQALVEATNIPISEFTSAAALYVAVNYNPTSANQITNYCFSFVYGVTPWPNFNNGSTLDAFKTANVNYITTAAEGGLSNTMLVWGGSLDGFSFNYWYAVFWTILNVDQSLSNEVINGSNNPLAPLQCNQNGINRLQNRAAKTLRNGVSYGIILGNVITVSLDPQVFAQNVDNGVYAGNCVLNAIPFQIWAAANPSAYSLQTYDGFQCVMTPQLGFDQIVFNLNVTEFV